MNTMGIFQHMLAFNGEANNFVEQVTKGLNGPPEGVFPHMPYRTQWNPKYPHLHTINAAVTHIVGDYNDNMVGPSALCVAHELRDMGFDVPDVHHTIASILGNKKHGFVKLRSRYYPDVMNFDRAEFANNPRQKSWATYALNQSLADRIDAAHTKLAEWLESDDCNNRYMLKLVNSNTFYEGCRNYWNPRR